MSKGKILVYDDDEGVGERYAESLRKTPEVEKNFKEIEGIGQEDFIDVMKGLKERQIKLRGREKCDDGLLDVDSASILVVDYDLVKAHDESFFLTGEIVSYYVRCFSRCKMIIGMNQFGDNYFDLTLKGHPKSYADVNIGSKQLTNPGLWSGKYSGFRPWSWPDIPQYLANLERKTKDIEDNFEKTPICDFFELPREIVGIMPRTISEFIGDEIGDMTFKDFLSKTGNGLAYKDKDIPTELMDHQIVNLLISSRISKWLEHVVLPGQNILIDAPHLVSRYPSLLKGSHSDLENWNKTASLATVEDLGIDYEKISAFQFKKNYWLSRPAWYLNSIMNCQDIKEVSDPWTKEATDYVFCEDTSSFHNKNDCREFLAELESPFTRRFVKKDNLSRFDYTPKVRLSM